jgi:hypothetical protein
MTKVPLGLFLWAMLCVLIVWAFNPRGGGVAVTWVGHPSTASDRGWTGGSIGYLPEYEIGFRVDGVVVWRAAATATTTLPELQK